MYFVGVDIGGTGIQAGVVNSNGEIIFRKECITRVNEGFETIVDDINKLVNELLSENNLDIKQIKSIGFCVPGFINKKGLVTCVNLGWKEVNFIEVIKNKFPEVNVYAENDATVAAVAEAKFGSMKNKDVAVMYTLGTGVGGGVIVDSKVVAGVHGAGGEIGHISVVLEDGNQCNCGKKGCLETVASATGIVRETEKYLAACDEASSLRELAKIEAKDVFDAAKAGDAVGVKMVNQLGRYIGLAAANLAVTTDPQKIIIGGGVSKAGDILIDTIEKHYKEFAFATVRDTQFVLAELGNDAGFVGSAYLAKMA